VIADRTACSILMLFIVTATSRPLNKKIRLLSIRGSNNYCTGLGRRSHRATAPCHCWQRTDSQPESHIDTYGVSSACQFFFVVHFVAKRYILQQKCLKGQIGTCMLGTRWWVRMHSVTDRRTDGRTDRSQTDGQQAAPNSRSFCVQYDRLKTITHLVNIAAECKQPLNG